jgi:hypothetical protein
METAMIVAITCQGLSAADLRQAAARTQEAKVARRMLAIALVLEGGSRAEAAETCAMDRQTLHDGVYRFNASGLDSLSDQPRRNGPLPRLSAAQQAAVAAWVDQGADLDATVWCGGGASICSTGSSGALASPCTSARSASCCTSCCSGACRCARSIRRATLKICL